MSKGWFRTKRIGICLFFKKRRIYSFTIC